MNFSTFLAVLNARKKIMLLILGVTVLATLVINLVIPSSYEGAVTVVVNMSSKDPITGLMTPAPLMSGYLATQVDIIDSHAVAAKVVDDLKLADNAQVKSDFQNATDGKGSVRDWLADLLMKNLTVNPSRESSAIEIDFKGTNPAFVAAIANAFAKAYIDTNLELRTEPAQQLTTWYQAQITPLRENVDKAQIKLAQYQRDHGLVASDQRLDVEQARLADLSNQLVAAQAYSYDAASRSASQGADVMNNTVVAQLQAELALKEADLAQLGKDKGINYPGYQQQKAQVDALKAKVDDAIKSASRVTSTTAVQARQREASLRAAMAGQKSHVLDMETQSTELAALTRDVESAQRIYDSALQRYSQARLESQSTQTDISILNPAIPPIKPSSPKILLNMLLAVFVGSTLSVGVAFLLEMLDRRVRGERDIVELLQIPVLSVLDKVADGESKRSGWIRMNPFAGKASA